MRFRILAASVLLFAGFATASAAPASAGPDLGPSPAAADTAHLMADFRCDPAPGPGALSNDTCTRLEETSSGGLNLVRAIHVQLTSSNFEGFPVPAEICGVKFYVWGTFNGGKAYAENGGDNTCEYGVMEWEFFPVGKGRAVYFKPGSYICGATEWNGQRSKPICTQATG